MGIISKEWIDFAIRPIGERLSLAERLDTDGLPVTSARGMPSRPVTEKFRISKHWIVDPEIDNTDEFDCIEITDYGLVTIWTRKKVWYLVSDGTMEKLKYVPRHPPE